MSKIDYYFHSVSSVINRLSVSNGIIQFHNLHALALVTHQSKYKNRKDMLY